jgi:hypothetical protein
MPEATVLAYGRQRIHLYEIAYWSLAICALVGAVNPDAAPDRVFALLFAGAGICAGLCILLSSMALNAREAPPVRRNAPALKNAEPSLVVALERARKGSFAALLLQMNRGAVEMSRKDSHAALQSASTLLRRYLADHCTVLRLHNDRVAAIMPGAGAFEVERLLDRLREDLRGWSGTPAGAGFTAGVVVDRNGSTPIETLVRDLDLAVRRAAVYSRDRFVISES